MQKRKLSNSMNCCDFCCAFVCNYPTLLTTSIDFLTVKKKKNKTQQKMKTHSILETK
jgi:hypothetical protein